MVHIVTSSGEAINLIINLLSARTSNEQKQAITDLYKTLTEREPTNELWNTIEDVLNIDMKEV